MIFMFERKIVSNPDKMQNKLSLAKVFAKVNFSDKERLAKESRTTFFAFDRYGYIYIYIHMYICIYIDLTRWFTVR